MPLQSQPKTLFSSTLTKVIENIDSFCEREKQKKRGRHLSDLRTLFYIEISFYNFIILDNLPAPYLAKIIFEILLKENKSLKLEIAKYLFTGKTKEIDFSLINFRCSPSIGSLLAVASMRCNQVRVYFKMYCYSMLFNLQFCAYAVIP